MRAGFGRERRLRTRAEFRKVYEHGARRHGRFLTAFFLPTERGVARLGLAVTRRFGGAVERNRARRWLREIFRQLDLEHGVDMVLVAKRSLATATFHDVEAEVRTLVEAQLRAWTGRPGGGTRGGAGAAPAAASRHQRV